MGVVSAAWRVWSAARLGRQRISRSVERARAVLHDRTMTVLLPCPRAHRFKHFFSYIISKNKSFDMIASRSPKLTKSRIELENIKILLKILLCTFRNIARSSELYRLQNKYTVFAT